MFTIIVNRTGKEAIISLDELNKQTEFSPNPLTDYILME